MIKYTVKDIEEPDFGCEGLPDGQVITDKVTLKAENGDIIKLDVADAYLYEKVEGLDAGANDYMEKPFHLQELEARVRSLTRRRFVQKDVCLECDGVKFNTRERAAYVNGAKVILTRKENGILEYLLLNQGRPQRGTL